MKIRIMQSTVERLLYILLVVLVIGQTTIYVKLYQDDRQRYLTLKSNQSVLICLVKGPPSLALASQAVRNAFVDNCIKENQ